MVVKLKEAWFLRSYISCFCNSNLKCWCQTHRLLLLKLHDCSHNTLLCCAGRQVLILAPHICTTSISTSLQCVHFSYIVSIIDKINGSIQHQCTVNIYTYSSTIMCQIVDEAAGSNEAKHSIIRWHSHFQLSC